MVKNIESVPYISYNLAHDHLYLINVGLNLGLKGQRLSNDVMSYWNGSRLVAIAMQNASKNLGEFMKENQIQSPAEMSQALINIGNRTGQSPRGAARWFLKDFYGEIAEKTAHEGKFEPHPLSNHKNLKLLCFNVIQRRFD